MRITNHFNLVRMNKLYINLRAHSCTFSSKICIRIKLYQGIKNCEKRTSPTMSFYVITCINRYMISTTVQKLLTMYIHSHGWVNKLNVGRSQLSILFFIKNNHPLLFQKFSLRDKCAIVKFYLRDKIDR